MGAEGLRAQGWGQGRLRQQLPTPHSSLGLSPSGTLIPPQGLSMCQPGSGFVFSKALMSGSALIARWKRTPRHLP